ncbi:hypothetical protein CK203_032660 [Vitis vinifera]|uniref:CRAL/TRIO N-terminal domain-containing protein n=1 Tax=Vitis vinifera TaxID=29760 RepID=A0A438HXS7_VITVI|nr:hypothetical protein CK203_032660 [Vitis vinifera]
MEQINESALTQMRKSVQKLGSSTEKYGDPTLMRFLIARSMDSEKAAKMFVQWQKWRAALVPDGSLLILFCAWAISWMCHKSQFQCNNPFEMDSLDTITWFGVLNSWGHTMVSRELAFLY